MLSPKRDHDTQERYPTSCTAFEGSRCIGSGDLKRVALKAKEAIDRNASASVLIFDDVSSELVEVDFRGTPDDVLFRLARVTRDVEGTAVSDSADKNVPRGPGRPKLGVVAREVTLLPRHWDWLDSKPGSASVALRRLVEEARRANAGKDRVRRSREAAFRFMSVMGGNEGGFEEALRALFAGNKARFDEMIDSWPADVRHHAKKLADVSFKNPSEETVQ